MSEQQTLQNAFYVDQQGQKVTLKKMSYERMQSQIK